MSDAGDLHSQRKAYYKEIGRLHLRPLWAVLGSIMTKEPVTRVQPCLWRWEEVRPRLLRAAELVTAEEAERRVLYLQNPGLPEDIPAITQTLYAGLQVILPGEIARSHRHTPAALRFIVEGEGAYTSVDGEQTFMKPGDFVLTPNWTWHDHGSTSDKPVIWLDGLDIPLVVMLNQVFADLYPEQVYPLERLTDESLYKWGNGMVPRWEQHLVPHTPVVSYKWERTEATLRAMAKTKQASPYDDIIFEYTNPLTGGPVLPTISAFIQMLRPGCETRAHRHTSSTVYMAWRGSGVTEINGQEFAWREKDIFVVPTWARHRHFNNSSTHEAILFSFSDEAALRPLGLYREGGE